MAKSATRQDRELEVLRQVVELHIETGAAVGSKAVATRMRNRLSSATIRAVMSDLDVRGWLIQPHTSAGRVPSDLGYRVYLDEVLGHPPRGSRNDRQLVDSFVWQEGQTVHDVLQDAAQLLSDQTGLAGLIAAPRLESAVLRQIEFVWLREGAALAIVVTSAGIVHERMLRTDPAVGRPELERFANYLNGFLPGLTLVEVRSSLDEHQAKEQAELSELEAQARELGLRALEDAEGAEVVVGGTAAVLEQQEFAEPGRAALLVRSLQRREMLIDVIDDMTDADDTRVYIGSEVGSEPLADCSVVTAGYSASVGAGLVALLGPKRLDYRRAIPLVGLVAHRLAALLETGDGRG